MPSTRRRLLASVAAASPTHDEFGTRSIIEDGPYEPKDFRAIGDG